MSEPTPQPEPINPPPLVLRVQPRKPRPGFAEAVLWCVVFVLVQLIGAIATLAVVLIAFGLRTDDAAGFITDQLAGLGAAAAPPTADNPTPPATPVEIGQAFAYGMLVAQIASLGLILLVVPRRVGSDWKRQLGIRMPRMLHLLLMILVVPAFMVLSDGFHKWFLQLTGVTRPAASDALNSTFGTVPIWVVFLAVAVGPGLVEELWCRGFLGRGLCARYGIRAGVLLTSLLFGVLHMDPSYVLVTALMGGFLHFVFFASRSIWVPILLHTLNNGLAILVSLNSQLQAGGERYEQASWETRATVVLVALALLISVGVTIWSSRSMVVRSTKELSASANWEPEYPGISAPPSSANAELAYRALSPAALFATLASFGGLVYVLSRI